MIDFAYTQKLLEKETLNLSHGEKCYASLYFLLAVKIKSGTQIIL
jgi:hypothetical protein